MTMSKGTAAQWAVAAALVLVASAGLSLLSFQFHYGEAHADRPIILFCVAYGVCWAGMVMGGWLAVRQGTGPLSAVILVGIAARCFMLPSNPVENDDLYRFVAGGHTLAAGLNPYLHTPESLLMDPPEAMAESVDSEEAQRVLARVAYPEVPQADPPLAQAVFAGGAMLTPWHWPGQRFIFMLVDFLTLAVILAALRLTERPMVWSVFYAWNPVVLKEAINGPHPDVIAALLIVVAVIGVRKWIEGENPAWAALCGAALGAGMVSAVYALLLFPAFVAVLARGQRRALSIATFAVPFAAVVAGAYAPFAAHEGVGAALMGLRVQAAHWRGNDGAFNLIAMALDQFWLASLESAVGSWQWLTPNLTVIGLDPLPALPRLVVLIVAVGASIGAAVLLYLFGESGDDFLWALRTTLIAFWLFLPAPLPWLILPIVALCALAPTVWTVALSGLVVLHYLAFYFVYQGTGTAAVTWTHTIEHVIVWLAIVIVPAMQWLQRHPPEDEEEYAESATE